MARRSESRSRAARRSLAAAATALGLATASVAVAAPAPATRRVRPAPPRPAQIESILLRETANGARLELAIDGAFDWTADRDGSGSLAIELANTRPAYGVVSRAFAGGLVAEYRLQSIGVPSRPVIRLLLVTREAVEAHVATAAGRLEIEVAPASRAARVPPTPLPARPPAPAIVPPAPPPAIESEALAPPAAAPVARLESAPIDRLTTPLAPAPAISPPAAGPPAPRLAWIEPAAPPPPPMAPAAEIETLAVPATPAPQPVAPPAAALPPRIAWTEIAVAPPPAIEASDLAPSTPARAAIPSPTEPAPPAPAGPATPSTSPPAPLPPPPPRSGPARRLAAIERLADGAVRLSGDGDFTFTAFRLEDPERFVIDLVGVVNQSASDSLSVDDGVLLQIRVAQYRTDPRPVTRVVFSLRAPAVPAIERVAGALVVRFGGGKPTVSALPAGRPAARAAAGGAAAAAALANPRRTTL